MAGEMVEKNLFKKAAIAAGLDEELYYFVLIDTMLSGLKPGTEAAKLMWNNIQALSAEIRTDGIEDRKRHLRNLVVSALENEISGRGQPVKATANRLAHKLYAMDSFRWLKLDQLAGVFYALTKESAA
jgi:hypothetical protein